MFDMGWTVVPASASFSKQKISIPQVTVKEAGYIFVYLSYEDESNNYVYFDDFRVTHTPGNIIQSNEYYPFGMQTANSWTRENNSNNFLSNGGTELNGTSQLYDLEFRNYDPILGRMNQVDPMADKYSRHTPYNYSFNSPVMLNDVNGADPRAGDWSTYGYNASMMSHLDGRGGGSPDPDHPFAGWMGGYGGFDMMAASRDFRSSMPPSSDKQRYQAMSDDEVMKRAQKGDADALDEYIRRIKKKESQVNAGQMIYKSGDGKKYAGEYFTQDNRVVGVALRESVEKNNGDYMEVSGGATLYFDWFESAPETQESDFDNAAKAARRWSDVASYASGALGGVQIGMLEYRQSLSLNSRVGTFAKFRIGYGQLGSVGRVLGRVGTAGSLVTSYMDYNSMQSGEIGASRFSYRLGGTASSIIGGAMIGSGFGGPFGALGGTTIGLIFIGGEMTYDGVVWFGGELSRGMVQTENALNGGWYPGK